MDKKPAIDTIPLDKSILDKSNPNNEAGLAELIDSYRIIEELSQGGMGTIYRAHQFSLNREVAIKTLRGVGDQQAADRFFREASLAAKLSDPHTVQLYDFGQTSNGTLYLVMELISGENLKDWISNHGSLEQDELIDVFLQLCGALAEAHELQLVHRDIKPSNIILTRRKGAGLHAKLIDFGLVKDISKTSELSHTGVVLGSPMYMSPEQVNGHSVDNRTDIYSLGMTLYHAATGRRPFLKNDIAYLLNAQLNIMPQPPSELNSDIGDTLEWIILSCICKNPLLRFQTVQQIGKSLQLCKSTINDTQPIRLTLKNGNLYNRDNLDDPISDDKALDRTFRPSPIELETLANERLSINQENKQFLMAYLPWVLVAILSVVIFIALFTDVMSFEEDTSNQKDIRSQQSQFEPISTETIPKDTNNQLNEKTVTPDKSETENKPDGIGSDDSDLIEVVIDSIPTGADIYFEEGNIGSTPHKLSLKKNISKSLVLKKKKFKTKVIVVDSKSLNPIYYLEEIGRRNRKKSKKSKKPTDTTKKTQPKIKSDANHLDGIRDPW